MAQVGSVLARREIDAGVDRAVPVLCLPVGDGCVAAGVAPDSGRAVAVRRSDCHPPERCVEDCDVCCARIAALLAPPGTAAGGGYVNSRSIFTS
ncbi:hypothetical protein ACFYWP_39495 [Actinacidiphila glaucinigra]|uniref:hypothetical protein n=1 Tax=Actinacidiphila glaucinigra TaxID=235986 RepID=UPI0036D02FAF